MDYYGFAARPNQHVYRHSHLIAYRYTRIDMRLRSLTGGIGTRNFVFEEQLRIFRVFNTPNTSLAAEQLSAGVPKVSLVFLLHKSIVKWSPKANITSNR